MNVLIIEDEPQALEGMKRMMEQLNTRVDQVFFCDRAADALEVIEAHHPELIITDIILPDMTGLDLLEHVHITEYAPKIIIVSGFDDFEYAKRGLKLGAIDYFLKPFDTEAFLSKIKECITWIEGEKKERQDRHRALELAHLGTRSMRDVFLLGLCLQSTALHEHIMHRLRIWELDWMSAQPYYVIALTAAAITSELSEKEEELQAFATGNIVDELMQQYGPSVTFMNTRKVWVILTPYADVQQLVEHVSSEILRYQKRHASIGVSERMSSFQSLHTAYRQAGDGLRAALLSKERDVYYYEQLNAHVMDSEEDMTVYMVSAIKARDSEAMRETAEKYIRLLVMTGKASKPSDISQRCMDWIMTLQDVLRKKAELVRSEIPVALWDELDECETTDDLSQALSRYLDSLSMQIREVNPNSIIEQALKLIHQKYSEDMKLQALADDLSIHPVWLSQLFKKEVGVNFLDYVTDMRIQKAKELLRQTNIKIYEVAGSVGYQDIHHFGRLFKKKTGVTPKAFRYGK
jgi:two-component system response regulator YesN